MSLTYRFSLLALPRGIRLQILKTLFIRIEIEIAVKAFSTLQSTRRGRHAEVKHHNFPSELLSTCRELRQCAIALLVHSKLKFTFANFDGFDTSFLRHTQSLFKHDDSLLTLLAKIPPLVRAQVSVLTHNVGQSVDSLFLTHCFPNIKVLRFDTDTRFLLIARLNSPHFDHLPTMYIDETGSPRCKTDSGEMGLHGVNNWLMECATAWLAESTNGTSLRKHLNDPQRRYRIECATCTGAGDIVTIMTDDSRTLHRWGYVIHYDYESCVIRKKYSARQSVKLAEGGCAKFEGFSVWDRLRAEVDDSWDSDDDYNSDEEEEWETEEEE